MTVAKKSHISFVWLAPCSDDGEVTSELLMPGDYKGSCFVMEWCEFVQPRWSVPNHFRTTDAALNVLNEDELTAELLTAHYIDAPLLINCFR